MKYLVLAEKPDQAKKYAQALGQAKNEKGAWKIKTALQLIGQGQKSKEWFIEQTKKAITAQLEKGVG